MIEIFLLLWAQLGKVIVGLGAGLVGLAFLAWLDRRANFTFSLERLTIPQALYLGARFLGVATVVGRIIGCLALLAIAAPAAASTWPTTYDAQIEEAARTYLPAYPWRLGKSQLIQESGLDPAARSPAGAEGLAQFMPGTWKEVTRLLNLGALPPTHAGAAILGWAVYQGRMLRIWAADRPWRDRVLLALASYNAGPGSILRAQEARHRLEPGFPAVPAPRLYADIIVCLPTITGPRHSRETTAYGPAIFRRWALLEGGLR